MGFKSMKKMETTEPSVDEVGKGMKKGGKVAKYAKGGSVRGYGVSKVTNKTKYV